MDRFLSRQSASSPGSNSAAQPVVTPGSSTAAQPVVTPGSSSAAQLVVISGPSPGIGPAHHGCSVESGKAGQPAVKLECLKDVRRWMTTPEVVNSNLDIGLVKEAVTVLSRAPRPRQEEVRPLQSKWGIARNREGMPRLLLDVIQELEQKVVNAAHRLANSVTSSAAQPAATCVASSEHPASSSSQRVSKKLKREHATASSSAAQPASRKRTVGPT